MLGKRRAPSQGAAPFCRQVDEEQHRNGDRQDQDPDVEPDQAARWFAGAADGRREHHTDPGPGRNEGGGATGLDAVVEAQRDAGDDSAQGETETEQFEVGHLGFSHRPRDENGAEDERTGSAMDADRYPPQHQNSRSSAPSSVVVAVEQTLPKRSLTAEEGVQTMTEGLLTVRRPLPLARVPSFSVTVVA